MTPSQLNIYRKQIFEQLEARGFPVSKWQAEFEKDQRQIPKNQRRRPFTTDVKFESPTINCIPAGFQEFRLHPAHGAPVRRCMAKHPDGNQCGRFALRDRRTCKRHSGGARHRSDSKRGDHWDQGKGESREDRKRRSEASRERRELERRMIATGESGPSIRGPRTTTFEQYLKQRKKTERSAMKRAQNTLQEQVKSGLDA